MEYRFCGKSGLQLPAISLGLWHNFGDVDNYINSTNMILKAFEKGITHFDLANNYGPPPGTAEINFGRIFKENLKSHRDEMIISSKAGHLMWDGPYGDGGSRKYIMASIDQSLKRTGLDYFDIFYTHRYDPQTPLEETIQAIIDIVKQGKALYAGISKYPEDKTKEACKMMQEQNVRCLIYQGKYNLLFREPETAIHPAIEDLGLGYIVFSPLAQGLLTNRYLNGIPDDSRVARGGFLQRHEVTPEVLAKVEKLNNIARERNQTLAEMALAWLLNKKTVTSVIVGASSVAQLETNINTLNNTQFTDEELLSIEQLIINH